MICTSTSVSSIQPRRCFSHLGWGFQPRRLKECVPKNSPTRRLSNKGKKYSGLCYTIQRQGPTPPPPRSLRPITVMLMPAYRPLVKAIKQVQKQIQVWPEGSSEALQDCFDTTDWDMFKQAATYNNTTDLQEYTETVTAYITKCIDDVTVTKTITVRTNQKPWLTGEVYRLLKARNAALR